jgi:peptidoglycan/LPS O-acetylase OafA/YrhL
VLPASGWGLDSRGPIGHRCPAAGSVRARRAATRRRSTSIPSSSGARPLSYREDAAYIDPLLALRGLCALGVLLVHALGASDLSFRHYLEEGWAFGSVSQAIVASLTPTTGKNFVLFFFVHSGYLIGKIFFMGRYGPDAPGILRYYRARLLRIAPLLYVNLVFCLLFVVPALPSWSKILGDFLFINNYTGRGINGVTWSMSWEMQYYLLAPFVFFAFRAPTRRNVAWVLGLAVACEILANLGVTKYPPIEFLFYFLLGFAINLMLRLSDRRAFRGSVLLAVGGGFFLGHGIYYALANNGAEPLANTLIGIASAMAIYLLELPRPDGTAARPFERYGTPRLLVLRAATWTGILSYGIYLWHLPLLSLLNERVYAATHALIAALGGVETGWLRMLLFHAVQLPAVTALTLAVSLLTFFTVELRFRPGLYNRGSSRFTRRLVPGWLRRGLAAGVAR